MIHFYLSLIFLARVLHSGRLGTNGLYYKPIMIINDDSRVVNKLEASLTDGARVVIYDRHMFIVQATACDHQIKLQVTNTLAY